MEGFINLHGGIPERRGCAIVVLQLPVATTGAVQLVSQLPQLPAGCETRRRFCNWASCGLVVVVQGDFATEIATAVAAELRMSDEWITGAPISAQSPSSVYRIV